MIPANRDFAEHKRATNAAWGDVHDLENDASQWDNASAVEAAAGALDDLETALLNYEAEELPSA